MEKALPGNHVSPWANPPPPIFWGKTSEGPLREDPFYSDLFFQFFLCGCGSKPMGSHFGVSALGVRAFDPWPCKQLKDDFHT